MPDPATFSQDELIRRFPQAFGVLGAPEPSEAERQAERDRQQQQEESDRARRRKDAARAFLQERGRRYEHCRLSNFDIQCDRQREVVAALTDYAKRMPEEVALGNGLILFGPSGTGKDHLLVAMAMVAIDRHGFSLVWRNGIGLYGSFREAIREDSGEDAIIRPLVHGDILVLSDPLPPAGELSEFQRSMLYRILEGRYSRQRPTWISANVKDREEVDQRMGPACADRLRHGALACYCNWPSYRAKTIRWPS